MKKIVSILLSVLIVFSIASCGPSPNEVPAGGTLKNSEAMQCAKLFQNLNGSPLRKIVNNKMPYELYDSHDSEWALNVSSVDVDSTGLGIIYITEGWTGEFGLGQPPHTLRVQGGLMGIKDFKVSDVSYVDFTYLGYELTEVDKENINNYL